MPPKDFGQKNHKDSMSDSDHSQSSNKLIEDSEQLPPQDRFGKEQGALI